MGKFKLAWVLQRMGEEHWDALHYVETYGVKAPQVEAFTDLEEWGCVSDIGDGTVLTTDLGDDVLDEQEAA
jgi:hypothetical protein